MTDGKVLKIRNKSEKLLIIRQTKCGENEDRRLGEFNTLMIQNENRNQGESASNEFD